MPPPQDNARVVFLIILLFWVATSPDNGPGFVAAPSLTRARLARQRHAHGVLNTTDWGAFAPHLHLDDPPPPPPPDLENDENNNNITIPAGYLNLTGFRKEDGLAWDDLGRFKSRCEAWSRNAVGDPDAQAPVWQNVSGVVKGPWVRRNASVYRDHSSYNLTAMMPNIEWVGRGADWLRNATGSEGTMMLRIEDEEEAGTEPENLHSVGGLMPAEVIAREVSATVTIDDDEGTGASFDMRLHGVHWPRQGALLLTTTSEKFAGIFGLPQLTTRQDFYESSKSLLNRTLDEVLRRKEKRTFSDPINPWAASIDSPGEGWTPAPHCEYVVYIQIHPPDKDILRVEPTLNGPENVAKAIEDLEYELRSPRGAPQQRHPKLQMSAVVYSPDCAFFLETRGPPEFPPADGLHLIGWKQEFWLHSVRTWLLGFALVIFCQVQLLKMQIKETSTPSTLGRVSFYTASIMLLADGITFLGSSAWSLSASTTMLPSLVVTVASFLAMIVSVAFLVEIFKVQEPEWRRQERERQRASAANTPRPPETPVNTSTTTPPNANADAVSNTILSTTARRANPRPPSPPIIIPSDQDIDAEIEEVTGNNTTVAGLPAPSTAANPPATPPAGPTVSTIFGRFILIGIGILFLSLAAITWRPHIRTTYFNLLAFTYLSLWVPQICRNIYRNCRRAFSWRFVVGQSMLRLLPISYFYTAQDNFAFAEPDWTAFTVLAGWLWVQIWVLVGQNVLGPRFGLPKNWMPEAWEYHPILREDNVESGGLPIGLVSVGSGGASAGGKHTTKIHVIDCAICREVLEVPVVKAGEADPAAVGGVAGVFARRVYMVTPCRHIFHSECLEGWMRFRLQCPICREELPPL
ncbi:ring finger ubiquitin ligase [Apiospora phragmitis]|uniref:RING-type E3 ubiquitin transferase n=1 Tax=Apiospora phragmitis TaxID=2905665 RepID=A0ABR1T3Y0_9PEZI